ncbi:MAG: hypothetical protein KA807_08980 [Prolixibacteraceae bacterium]|nr:hypothetical protein [Prolixibacteraceae bacterium]
MEKMRNIKITDSMEDVVNYLSYLKVANWNFPTLYTLDYFKWKIIKNPFLGSLCYLRYVNDVPASHVSITSKPINDELGISAHCGELGDTHTHPAYQKQGHFGVIGTAAIADFQKQFPGAFVFGIPNENAVHGWQSRCNCELLNSLNIEEYSMNVLLKRKISQSLTKYNVNNEKVKDLIDHIWQKTYKRKCSLYKKDYKWIEWRYKNSSEKYNIYFSRGASKSVEAYIIAKITKKYFFTHFQICDIVGLDHDAEIIIFDNFIKQYVSSFSKITIWSSKETGLNAYLVSKRFNVNRKINFVCNKNEAYEQYLLLKEKLIISLGDTDNV